MISPQRVPLLVIIKNCNNWSSKLIISIFITYNINVHKIKKYYLQNNCVLKKVWDELAAQRNLSSGGLALQQQATSQVLGEQQ